MIDEILSLVDRHERWRGGSCLNLIPSENVTSPAVRSLLSSELVHRYTSRQGFYMGTRFIDELEMLGEELAREIFRSETADLRPLSGHLADVIFLACFSQPNDTLLCVSPEDGGYPGVSQQGISRFLGLRVRAFPFSREEMNIKVDEAVELVERVKPKIVLFGASLILFPQPVREISKIAREVGAVVGYDGAHVLGLIAGGEFQDPLREGAAVLLGSTHKTLFGPQGGIILADREHGMKMKDWIDPAFVDNAHWNRIAALTLALAEMRRFGREYARQVVRNAGALARALAEWGLPVACPGLGYTRSHQVFLNYGEYKRGREVAERLEKAGIIVDCGVRLGVCEVTRRGMKEEEMGKVAEFVGRVAVKGEDPRRVGEEVARFMKDFQEVHYCFR